MAKLPYQVRQAVERAEQLAEKTEQEVVEETVEEVKEPQVNWQHKYETVNGMLKAEAARRKEEREAFEKEKQELLATIAQFRDVQVASRKQQQLEFSDEDLGISQEDLDEFDKDSLNLIRKTAKAAAQQALTRARNEVQEELNTLKTQVRTQPAASQMDENEFLSSLTDAVEDWQEINSSPGFHSWLAEEDPVAGRMRDLVLKDAASVFDVRKVANIFKAYKNTLPPKRTPKAQPESVSAQAAPTNSNPANLTAAGYKRFMSEVARGLWKTRPAEAKRLEAAYEKAIVEGTLRQ